MRSFSFATARRFAMNAGDVMTRPVISVSPDTAIAEAARLMLQHRISGLPVVEADGAVVGMVTEGDLLRRAETGTQRRHAHWLEFILAPGRFAQDYTNANARKVGEVMSGDVVSAAPDDPLEDVVRLMERRRIKRVPIVENSQLVGIVSRANLVRALVRAMARPVRHGAISDEEIRDHILAEIDKQPWGPRASVSVRVKNGVAELHGTIVDERERAALQVLAESTLGVKSVLDHLVWVEPLSGFVIPPVGSEPAGRA
jgi:CBS domain-containing protein